MPTVALLSWVSSRAIPHRRCSLPQVCFASDGLLNRRIRCDHRWRVCVPAHGIDHGGWRAACYLWQDTPHTLGARVTCADIVDHRLRHGADGRPEPFLHTTAVPEHDGHLWPRARPGVLRQLQLLLPLLHTLLRIVAVLPVVLQACTPAV